MTPRSFPPPRSRPAPFGPEVPMVHMIAVRQKPEHEILERWIEAKNEKAVVSATAKHFDTVFIARRFMGRPFEVTRA